VKKSKVAAHGQGGVGKTTMASAVVRDSVVRNEFERIAWVSVGQTPAVMELQRSLFHQLTAEPMQATGGANTTTQLQDLRAACTGQRWLVVLDDVWETEHEKQLSCVDVASPSKLLVTTRVRYSFACFASFLFPPEPATDIPVPEIFRTDIPQPFVSLLAADC
jgi:GTPase SAR1 family protein